MRNADSPSTGTLGSLTSKANRPELKRYRQYTRHDIAAAIEAVRGGMSALQASRLYGVPSRTLYDKVYSLLFLFIIHLLLYYCLFDSICYIWIFIVIFYLFINYCYHYSFF